MSTSDTICKDGVSKSSEEEDDVCCEVSDMLRKMGTDDKDVVLSVCANCGKTGDNLKACTACKLVKYCNRECQIAHRPKHKRECRKRAAELHDEELFKQPPPEEDCPICFQLLPSFKGSIYKTCCGKVICSGCINAPVYDNEGNEVDNKKCPFCRTPTPTSEEEMVKREKKRMDLNDHIAIYNQGCNYHEGACGFPQDHDKALELFHRAGDLGYAGAYLGIGNAYDVGQGVEVDKKKATHYYELAAMKGNALARQNLGREEGMAGNMDRALKHHLIAVRSGCAESLNRIKIYYSAGLATKSHYTKALQSYQTYLGEIKSDQRDKAAASSEMYRYY